MREVSPLKRIDGPDPNFKDICFQVAARYYVLQTCHRYHKFESREVTDF